MAARDPSGAAASEAPSRAAFHKTMNVHHARVILLLTAGALAGCSSSGKDQQAVDPNTLPANYRTQLVIFLRQSLTNRADFRGAMISEPAIKSVGPTEHYVVCVQFNP